MMCLLGADGWFCTYNPFMMLLLHFKIHRSWSSGEGQGWPFCGQSMTTSFPTTWPGNGPISTCRCCWCCRKLVDFVIVLLLGEEYEASRRHGCHRWLTSQCDEKRFCRLHRIHVHRPSPNTSSKHWKSTMSKVFTALMLPLAYEYEIVTQPHKCSLVADTVALGQRRYHWYMSHSIALSAHCTPAPSDTPTRPVRQTYLCRRYVHRWHWYTALSYSTAPFNLHLALQLLPTYPVVQLDK